MIPTGRPGTLPHCCHNESGSENWSTIARVAELADALDLGSSGETLGSSSLPSRTIHHFAPQLEASRQKRKCGSHPSRYKEDIQMRNAASVAAVILVCLLFGCAASTPMPKTPEYRTTEGRACAAECQRNYESCVQAWKYTGSFSSASPERVNECRQLLGDCYQFCFEDEKTESP